MSFGNFVPTGQQAATENVAGSAPASFLESIGDVLIGGARRFIDLEFMERAGSMPTAADLAEENPRIDPSQPQVAGFGGLMTEGGMILLVLGGALALMLFKK